MHHHGKGVYSGTLSGTLNPALQDKNGQPKRDISTIVHILNDLLCAQYKAYNANGSSSRSTRHSHKDFNKASDSADANNDSFSKCSIGLINILSEPTGGIIFFALPTENFDRKR